MKKLATILFLFLVSINSMNAYGKDFINDDSDIRITLPRFVNFTKIVFKDELEKVDIINKTESYSNEYVTVNINKPHIQIINNLSSEKNINSKIDAIINNFKNKIIEDSMRDNEFNIINGLPVKQYVVSVKNSIHYNKNNILSLTIELYSFTGGAHGSTTEISLNIDTNTGKNGSLKDFLGNNPRYDEIILNEIKVQIAKNPEMFFQDMVDKLTKLPENQKFFLVDDGVVVYFDEYEIAPYVAGRPQFFISFTQFPNGLNEVNIPEDFPIINK